MKIKSSELGRLISSNPDLKLGCLIDTNVLFAASFPLDELNEWAEGVFQTLKELGIPTYTNINIRSEFIDLNRRVLIPEGLVSLYDSMKGELDPEVEAQLKSLKTQKDRAAGEEKVLKFNDQQVKKFRTLLLEKFSSSGENGWDLFCRDYLEPFISSIWDNAVDDLGIQFVGIRAIEEQKFFEKTPHWEDAVKIVGRSGIGSSDAMILNLFFCSKFKLIATADQDVAYTVEKLGHPSKYVLAPGKR